MSAYTSFYSMGTAGALPGNKVAKERTPLLLVWNWEYVELHFNYSTDIHGGLFTNIYNFTFKDEKI